MKKLSKKAKSKKIAKKKSKRVRRNPSIADTLNMLDKKIVEIWSKERNKIVKKKGRLVKGKDVFDQDYWEIYIPTGDGIYDIKRITQNTIKFNAIEIRNQPYLHIVFKQ